MNRKRVGIAVTALVFAFSAVAFSGQEQKPPTNDDVARLLKSGLAESTIVSVIQLSPNRFDTSAGGLARLKRSKLAEAGRQTLIRCRLNRWQCRQQEESRNSAIARVDISYDQGVQGERAVEGDTNTQPWIHS